MRILNNNRIFRWVKKRKKSLATVIVLFIFCLVLTQNISNNNGIINTIVFSISECILTFVFIIKIKNKKISIIYLVGMFLVSLICLLSSASLHINSTMIWVRSTIFVIQIIIGLVVIWIAKKKCKPRFTLYLLISLLIVILNFGGFYYSVYSMYYPFDQESFKIEQGMSWPQSVKPLDFIYYSADAFFGTSISDVSINYLDYMDWYDKNSLMSIYRDKYDAAMLAINIVKISSLIESVLFLIYISIIVINTGDSTDDWVSDC